MKRPHQINIIQIYAVIIPAFPLLRRIMVFDSFTWRPNEKPTSWGGIHFDYSWGNSAISVSHYVISLQKRRKCIFVGNEEKQKSAFESKELPPLWHYRFRLSQLLIHIELGFLCFYQARIRTYYFVFRCFLTSLLLNLTSQIFIYFISQ